MLGIILQGHKTYHLWLRVCEWCLGGQDERMIMHMESGGSNAVSSVIVQACSHGWKVKSCFVMFGSLKNFIGNQLFKLQIAPATLTFLAVRQKFENDFYHYFWFALVFFAQWKCFRIKSSDEYFRNENKSFSKQKYFYLKSICEAKCFQKGTKTVFETKWFICKRFVFRKWSKSETFSLILWNVIRLWLHLKRYQNAKKLSIIFCFVSKDCYHLF